jgi:hypothetical protein
MEVEHIAERAISDGWAVDRDIVLVAPVVDTLRMIDLFPQTMNQTRRSPACAIVDLFISDGVENWSQPILEETIIIVWN